jgi:hypothetical protein
MLCIGKTPEAIFVFQAYTTLVQTREWQEATVDEMLASLKAMQRRSD